MNKGKILLIIGCTLLLGLVGHYGLKMFIFEAIEPTLAYSNKFKKKENIRSNFKSAEFCAACHKNIYDQWKESYMSKSYSAGIGKIELHALSLGLRGMKQTEKRWCVECHFPLALTAEEDFDASDPIIREGVTCTVCHSVVEAHPDASPANFKMDPLGGMNGPFDDSLSPMHATRRSKLFMNEDSSLCGTCHYSAWPGNNLPIDWTYPEWLEYCEMAAKKGETAKSCQECHMPAAKGKAAQLANVPERKIASHKFPGGRNEELVKKSAEFTYELGQEEEGAVLKVMVKNLAGHNLPTGNASWPLVNLVINFVQGNESREIAAFNYHTSYLLKDGSETYDTTIGHESGPDTTLKPFETRVETIKLPEEMYQLHATDPEQYSIEITLSHHYIRILDANAPFFSEGNKTYAILLHIYQWLTLNEVNLKHIMTILTDRETYKKLEKISEMRTLKPTLIMKKIIKE